MFSAMNNGAIARALGITIPSWQEAITGYLKDGVIH
jgi:dTDP-4-dehydrorhamnose reductase